MKALRNTIIVLWVVLANSVFAQSPQPLPCYDINNSNKTEWINKTIDANCVESKGSFNAQYTTSGGFNTNSGVTFTPGATITAGQGNFKAAVLNNQITGAWYAPNTVGTVGEYEKLEIGIAFAEQIEQAISNYVSEKTGEQLNPFNPEDVDIQAEFTTTYTVYRRNPKTGEEEFFENTESYKAFGFFYEPFSVIKPNPQDGRTWYWEKQANQHRFRVRFAPRRVGTWTCTVTANIKGYGTVTLTPFNFECVSSNTKPYLSVHQPDLKKRSSGGPYFKRGSEPFFPVGHNVPSPVNAEEFLGDDYGKYDENYALLSNPENYVIKAPFSPYLFELHQQKVAEVADNGVNYVRVMGQPYGYEIEFEKLNNYYSRLHVAAEFDNLLDIAKQKQILLHYTMAAQKPFNKDKGNWDWTNYANAYPCQVNTNDRGYCYSNIPNIGDPINFLTDERAKKHYKNRLRYIVARWGYSTNIGVLELICEFNGAIGNEAGYTDPPGTGCDEKDGYKAQPYEPYKEDPSVPAKVYQWHEEMTKYMKEELNAIQPTAANYAGTPAVYSGDGGIRIYAGDLSYFSPYVDVMTFNSYYYSALKEKEITEIYDRINDHFYNQYPDLYKEKPLFMSEIGGGSMKCQSHTVFMKEAILTPFTGLAGQALPWHNRFNEYGFWQQGWYQNMNNFMKDVPLQLFHARQNVASSHNVSLLKKVHLAEVFALLLKVPNSDHLRAVGAINNRTYNYYSKSQFIERDSCQLNSDIEPSSEYLESKNIFHTTHTLKLEGMGGLNRYTVEWYNPINGQLEGVTETRSSILGALELEYPYLTADDSRPLVLFKLYRSVDGSFLRPEEQQGMQIMAYEMGEVINQNEKTSLNQQVTDKLVIQELRIYPNPSTSVIKVEVPNFYGEAMWEIKSIHGKLLLNGTTSNEVFDIDVSELSAGSYIFTLFNPNEILNQKIIKQ
jgi:hypothetical protein